MITAYAFMAANFIGYILALSKSPFWGLFVCINIYFNAPDPTINWWAGYIPDMRWSVLTTLVMIISLFIHKEKLSKNPLESMRWAFVFTGLTAFISLTWAVKQDNALEYTQMIVSFCITCFCFIKCIKNEKEFRLIFITIIALAGNLSVKTFLYGRRVNQRLENIGTTDTHGSNEFALLLVGILPLMVPFIMKGRWYERVICILSLPFIVNAFILCNSRGAFVAICLSILIVMFFIPDKHIRKVIFITVICAIPVFLYLSDQYFIERLASLGGLQEGVGLEDPDANKISSGRLEIWNYGIQMVNDHPLGVGPNGFKHQARFYMPPEVLSYHPGMPYGVRAAHNTLLQVLVEQGYLGLCIFLGMCIYTLKLLFKAIKTLNKRGETNGFWGYAIMGLTISFCSILFGGLFSSRVYYEFFWWQIAFSVITYSYIMRKENDKSVL